MGLHSLRSPADSACFQEDTQHPLPRVGQTILEQLINASITVNTIPSINTRPRIDKKTIKPVHTQNEIIHDVCHGSRVEKLTVVTGAIGSIPTCI